MREVIQKVLAEEAEAKGILASAHVKADGIIKAAAEQATDLVARAQKEASAEARMKVAVAIQSAEKERTSRLSQALAEIRQQVQLEPAVTGTIVNAVVRCVAGQCTLKRE
jgi:vacuolar-type H+-ATPase subunit H